MDAHVEICQECAIERNPWSTLPQLTGFNRTGKCEDCGSICKVATVAHMHATREDGIVSLHPGRKRGRPSKDHVRLTMTLERLLVQQADAHGKGAGLKTRTAAIEDLMRRGLRKSERRAEE